jgi:transposase
VRDVDHLAVVSRIWDELGLTDLIDDCITHDPQQAMSGGQVLKALVLNVTGGRDPLYRVRPWAEQVPLELLLGDGASPEHLNDTSLGRHLDRLFEVGPEGVFNAVSLRVIEREGLCLDTLHGDTTSRLVFGKFERPAEEGVISITRGHSKDKRPDLKQIMYALTTCTDGIPVAAEVLSGNTSDKTWHGDNASKLRGRLGRDTGTPLHYVGDSALITEANLKVAAAQGIVLTSRLPRTYSAADTAVLRALYEPLPMKKLGAFSPQKNATRYEGCLLEDCELMGHKVKLAVYRPTPANERTRGAVLARRTKEMAAAEKAAKKLMSMSFACEPDAQAALEGYLQAVVRGPVVDRLFGVEGAIIEVEVPVKRGRGRPPKGQTGLTMTIAYQVQITLSANAEVTEEVIARESCFVLVHTGKEPITAQELLRIYKGQSVVETRFPFLKDPSWADVFFVKTPRRVEAMGYVLLLSLLVWSVWERRVRLNLRASGEPPIVDVTGVKKPNPTAMVCVHVLRGIKVMRAWVGDAWTTWQLVGALKPEQQRVIRFSGAPPLVAESAARENRALLP